MKTHFWMLVAASVLFGCTDDFDIGTTDNGLAATPEEVIPGLGVQTGHALDPGELDAFAPNGVALARVNFIMHDGHTADVDGSVFWWAFDDTVRFHAERGVQILPVLLHATAEGHTRFVPGAELGRWERFAETLALRYGPGGAFWSENAQLTPRPLRAWEIWNEPNLSVFWDARPGANTRPSASRYRRMLRAAHLGLRRADPRARVVFGGLAFPHDGPNVPWREFLLQALDGPNPEARRRNRCLLDAVGIHPYAESVDGVIGKVHEVLGALRDEKLSGDSVETDAQIWLTEVGWAVPVPGAWPRCKREEHGKCVEWADNYTVEGEDQVAARLTRTIAELDQHAPWRLGPIAWYTFEDLSWCSDWWCYAGMFTADAPDRRTRPAWSRLGEIANGRWVSLPPVRCETGDESFYRGDDGEDAAWDAADEQAELIPIARLYHPEEQHHLYSRDSAEVAGTKWIVEAEGYFRLFPWQSPDHAMFFRCYLGAAGHLLTTSDVCEGAPGAVNEGALGLIAVAPLEGYVELHRLFLPQNGDHFYTVDWNEVMNATSLGYVHEGAVGWVLPGF